ncbi:hypothetical protein E9232_003961 [Inquilinus ginsengisoli]|uniref:Uncharacterized protein n=1 Tax=Inquilinus ginsengisoli TaxID=363840 RepID=A0ABU1JS46_9PROT|nr:hypothetical protein [Inquilinus ginsengisoli]MDR6291427.1 hypothetical protein [Inquilinus ginsengisoli]
MSDQAENARAILFARILAHELVKAGLDQQRLSENIDPHYIAELERIVAQLDDEMSAARNVWHRHSGIPQMITAARERIANDEVEPTP